MVLLTHTFLYCGISEILTGQVNFFANIIEYIINILEWLVVCACLIYFMVQSLISLLKVDT